MKYHLRPTGEYYTSFLNETFEHLTRRHQTSRWASLLGMLSFPTYARAKEHTLIPSWNLLDFRNAKNKIPHRFSI